MHSMWKGAISFGLVMIPVRLYAATEQKDISFRQVHRADGGRIRFQRICSVCGQEVPYSEVAKGYELPTGEVVILDDEDLASLPLPTAKAIEVLQFAPAEQLDPILFNRSYYVEPEAAGVRAYVLLREALAESGKVAVAQVALRQRESLATLRGRDGVLVLETLLWPDEVRKPEFAFLDSDVETRPAELAMASSLIESMTADFEPAAHHDRYREALTRLVDAKVRGAELLQPAEVEIAASPGESLAEALRASLASARQALDGGTEPKPDGARRSRARSGGTRSGNTRAAPGKSETSRAASGKSGAPVTAGSARTDAGDDASARIGTGRGTGRRTAPGTAKPAGTDRPVAR